MEELVKAPVDNKNISTDWIEEVFDNFDCIEIGSQYVGFVNDVPAWCKINDNSIKWELCGDVNIERAFTELKYRLKNFDNENKGEIIVKYVDHCYGFSPISGTTQYFYFDNN